MNRFRTGKGRVGGASVPASRYGSCDGHLLPLGGLESLWKRRKEFAGGEGPLRAERAGASESLGWDEGGNPAKTLPPEKMKKGKQMVKF